MRKRFFAALLAAVSLLILTACASVFPKDYAAVIRLNWGLDLPAGCTEVYAADSGASIHGDGVRYHALSCPDAAAIDALVDWDSGGDHSDAAERYLDEISVPADKRPPYGDCVQWYYARDDFDTIILLWDRSGRMLYVVESFI